SDDTLCAHLCEQCGADDRRLLGFVADGTQTHVASFGHRARKRSLVCRVETCRLGDECLRGAYALFTDVDRQHFDLTSRERAGDSHSELAESNYECLFPHRYSPLRPSSADVDLLF